MSAILLSYTPPYKIPAGSEEPWPFFPFVVWINAPHCLNPGSFNVRIHDLRLWDSWEISFDRTAQVVKGFNLTFALLCNMLSLSKQLVMPKTTHRVNIWFRTFRY